jgi:hypothetical protein
MVVEVVDAVSGRGVVLSHLGANGAVAGGGCQGMRLRLWLLDRWVVAPVAVCWR